MTRNHYEYTWRLCAIKESESVKKFKRFLRKIGIAAIERSLAAEEVAIEPEIIPL